ncbi:hypothetical protein TanjilG_11368 [Lupinus angustifolius]|uniref:TCP domain-containing protein n=1 Tax=Lupinus angustifolius TaxID=3871 RepID=A0A1J7HMC3_LUPAN|nr:PREDICTED: transcription factor TCP2-like [Lupinus angustifolius]XP_019439693.1 PREDICTED: transcription factor TCP2-like [Lupinus angustifolius]XP_019439694.1 PREDICTED: transcription factor TCP2-like [Lupinus angustifolius]OIW14023.1 hypothetical protein TanjilG_11368 [Lupinus angustifolius]
MEEDDEIQAQQACKYPRIGSKRNESSKLGGGDGGSKNCFHSGSNWNNASRIVRVSRASGGKDRHSKVMTSKGLRDRRVRLSVTTAIQFYDLQDRLGYEQPSKAVEWLINAASDAISELPPLNTTFPDTPNQQSDEKRPCFDEVDGDTNNYQNQCQSQNLSLSKSACSSTSETSKGSGLSLSRSEIQVKAKEKAAKDKEKENESSQIAHHHHHHHHNVTQTASFTELLTGGFGNVATTATSPNGAAGDETNLFNKAKQWSHMAMDYFNSGLMVGPSSSSRNVSPFSAENQSEQLQHFPFITDHNFVPSSQSSGNDYNLNFTISPCLAGYNRGTLQSNSTSHIMPHMQFSGSTNLPFFIGGEASHSASAAPTIDATNHHQQQQLQFSPVFDGRLQICYGDGTRHPDQKGKAKN